MGVTRKTLKDFTLSDGTVIPKGALVGVAAQSLHHDQKLYENANVFEPFRFADMRDSEADEEGPKYQFVSTAIEYLPFGYGKHAWYARSLSFVVHEELTHLIV